MRSSQNSAGAPFSANFFAQNVFPAPDMPTSASRMGLSLLVSRRIREFSTIDRKSTRLNSSHGYISYAVFCLKKKKRNTYDTNRCHHNKYRMHCLQQKFD